MAGGGIKEIHNTIRGGADGATFVPSVDGDGNLSWSNNKGYSNPSTVNIKGPKGEKGEKGEIGPQGPQGEIGNLSNFYPVGSIYMSTNSTSPASFLGGTWERIQDKFLLSAGSSYSAGSEGGSATHSHTVKGQANILITAYALVQETYATGDANFTSTRSTATNEANYEDVQYFENATKVTGTAEATNNMPPYLAVYMWRRVS